MNTEKNDEPKVIEPTPEDLAKMEAIAKNMQYRFHTVNAELFKITGKMGSSEKMGAQMIVNEMKKYMEFQNALYSLQSLYDAIFPQNTPPTETATGEKIVQMLTPESVNIKPEMSIV